MTTAQRIALARAFVGLQERIATKPVTMPHPVIEKRKPVIVRARRGAYRRRMMHSEE